MKKDIPFHPVTGVKLAIAKEETEHGTEWAVYILNLNLIELNTVMITSKGYGELNGEKKQTSVLRHMIKELGAQCVAKVEPIDPAVFSLNNEFWTERFEDLLPRLQEEWLRKERFIQHDKQNPNPGDLYFERAGIHAEFGQIICIGKDARQWNPASRTSTDRRQKTLGNPSLDTLELWKFGDYKHYTRLELLAAVLGIQSSKDDIDGSQVNATFYHENDLEKIKQYCLRDVEVTARVFLAMNPQPETLEIELIPQEDSRKDHTD
ncbi:hypothetical protein GHT06_003750 [Daphnia sinensis]|uniref:Predicted 3'-5' exonuclease PolB-like domain-containing protein n=1 Tax=Daphnia sinensis TaxID=1820382 RepID=A0AAD5KDB1_9CRUS|nr:hypothetical protein GHT06_003750 [Daphnia sinensis]